MSNTEYKLTDEQIWKNDAIMECNAHIGAPMAELMRLVRAIEAATAAKLNERIADLQAKLDAAAVDAERWFPIETAPKDGTDFLFNAPQVDCGVSIGYIKNGVFRLTLDGKPIGPHVVPPTRWKPLPPPPIDAMRTGEPKE